MKLEKMFLMSWQNLKRNRRRIVFSSLGVVFGLATLLFFFSLTSGIRTLIFDHFLEQLPANQLKVSTAGEDFGDEDIEAMAGIEGVASANGVQLLHADSVVYFFGLVGRAAGASSNVICAGIEEFMVRDELPQGVSWSVDPADEEIPVLINPQLLAAWNQAVSSNLGFRRLEAEDIGNVAMDLVIRYGRGERIEYRLKAVGLSTRAPIFGPLVPMEITRHVNNVLDGDYANTYSTIYVTCRSTEHVLDIEDSLRRMGYTNLGDTELAETINTGINILTLFLSAISLVIVVISLVNILNIFLINIMERKYEIGVQRAVGASRGDIRAVIFTESAIIGLANGIAASLVGIGAVMVAEPLLRSVLEGFIIGDFTVFVVSPWIVLAIIIASPILNLIAAFQPANYAARLDPVEALRV